MAISVKKIVKRNGFSSIKKAAIAHGYTNPAGFAAYKRSLAKALKPKKYGKKG